VVKFNNVRNLFEALLKLLDLKNARPESSQVKFVILYLLEVVAKFDNRHTSEHPVVVHYQTPMFESEEIALNAEQVRAILDRQEARSWDDDAPSILEVFDGGTSGGFELIKSA
jgi:hypothetical protein